MNSWYLLLLTPLLAYVPPSPSGLAFYPIYLLIPYAALLGRRFGPAGVISVAIGGFAFVLSARLGNAGHVGGAPAVYLLALLTSVLAASQRPLAEWSHWPADTAMRRLAFAAPLLLVTGFDVNPVRSGQPYAETMLGFSFSFSLLGGFLLFLAGARGTGRRPWIVGLILTFVVSWSLAAFGLQGRPRSLLYLWIGTLQIPTVIAATLAYSAGSLVAATLRGESTAGTWRWPRLWIIVLLLVAQGPQTVARVELPWPGLPAVALFGSATLLLLASLYAGLVLGRRGVSYAFGAGLFVTCLCWLWDGIASHGSSPLLRIETPFVAGAWAWLGALMAQPQSSPGKAFRALMQMILLLAATVSVSGDGDSPLRLALAIALLLTGIAIALIRWRWGRRLADAGVDLDQDHWHLAGVLLLTLVIVAANWETYGSEWLQIPMLVATLVDRPGEWLDGPFPIALLILSLAAMVPVARDAWRILRSMRSVVEDLRHLACLRKRQTQSSSSASH